MVPIDGKLPNLALMRIAAWEKSQGARVTWRSELPRNDLFKPEFDRVYGSAIFDTSGKAVAKLREAYPHALIGGDGGDQGLRVEDIVPSQFTGIDYAGYPEFKASIGYAMRGCRFKCDHCAVPKREGPPRPHDNIEAIWRGPGFPKHIHLLDNDFFGNRLWRERKNEIVSGKFKVCLNQGVTARVMNDEQAEAVVELHPWDDQFKRGRLYVAWDSIDQERVFMRGIDRLERAGWKPEWVFSYMLIGHDPAETIDTILYRFNAMKARGVRPYPMPFNKLRETDPERFKMLKRFQRWVIGGAHTQAPFSKYNPSFKRSKATPAPSGSPSIDETPDPQGDAGLAQ
jgi:hypothetical protein